MGSRHPATWSTAGNTIHGTPINWVRPLTHALVIAVLYVFAWLAFFAARVPGPFELALFLAIATSVAAGWAIGRWWAILLPIGVVPILASSLPYTPGGAPEYGIGILVGAGFALLAMVLLGTGVLGAKLTGH